MYLIAQVRYLADYSGREWPPSPARFFKALVAVSRHGVPGVSSDEADRALSWLEQLEPPMLLASVARQDSTRFQRFVPNNSEGEWPARRASKEPETLRSWRFDSEGLVIYAWDIAAPRPESDIVVGLACRVASLGRGEDFVAVEARHASDLPNGDGLQRYRQADSSGRGIDLEAPELGSLAWCLEFFRRRAADPGWNRIQELPTMGTQVVSYRTEEGITRHEAPMAVYGLWRGTRRYSMDGRLLRVPVGQCRHLLSEVLDDAVGHLATTEQEVVRLRVLAMKLICGHEPTGPRVAGPHTAVVPLPTVFGPYPDGRVRRVALIGFGCAEEPARSLFDIVAALLHDQELRDRGQSSGVFLRRERDSVWCDQLGASSAVWDSVTPVVLERNQMKRREQRRLGKALRALRGGDAVAALEASALQRVLVERRGTDVRRALERVLSAEVLHVEVSHAPRRAGVHMASAYRAAGYLSESPRVHVHLQLRQEVRGPLLVGRGRYVGLGLMLPGLA